MGTLANSEDPDEMLHNATLSSESAVFAKTKLIFGERNTIFFRLYPVIPQYIQWTILTSQYIQWTILT